TLTKEIVQLQVKWVSFYSVGVVAFAIIGVAGTVLSLIYFNKKYKTTTTSWQSKPPSLSAPALQA
ncbi:hypothetical protein, partial [Rhizobium leguminosarum]|uniref:hypothetical protein n=1 Tax=Rhizobium leguminosarum TaxID=384 RepID=UPI003F9BE298